MDAKKAIAVVTYDDAASDYYFLIFQTAKEWVLPKTLMKEGEEGKERVQSLLWQVGGIRQYKIVHNMVIDVTSNDVDYQLDTYVVQTSMNTPITLAKEHYTNYLWSLYDRAVEKLAPEDKKLIAEAKNFLTSI